TPIQKPPPEVIPVQQSIQQTKSPGQSLLSSLGTTSTRKESLLSSIGKDAKESRKSLLTEIKEKPEKSKD
ncbi:MAG: hypothetical protein MI892_29365, partial [Desulfobacterales bacterium]|nr:hypothetical protein [Desulfobacterales bacterium]